MVTSLATLAVALQTAPSWVILGAALGAALVGLVGVILGAAATALLNQRGNKQLQENKIFFESLEWFTKGRQRRNVGITAVEAFQDNKRLRSFSIPLLIGTVIYLLRESVEEKKSGKQKEIIPNTAEHDLYNMDRLMKLLLLEKDPTQERRAVYQWLLDIIKTQLDRIMRLLQSKQNAADLTQERRADYQRLLDIIETQAKWQQENYKGLRVESRDLNEWAKNIRSMGVSNSKET